MNKLIFILIILLKCLASEAITVGDWQNIRCSGLTVANQVFVRLENIQSTAADNRLLYYDGAAISESEFSVFDAVSNTHQAVYSPVGINEDLGLMSQAPGQSKKIVPVYYSGTGMPAPAQLTNLSADAANDQSTNHLDIVADYFTHSGTKFYGAIQNRGGGFPQTGSLGFPPYYAYMVVMADPASDPSDPNTVVWAMNYMNVAFGGITPGLYKITGTSAEDLIRIGDISTSVISGSNLLNMSCNKADLLSDPDFTSWYNINGNAIGVLTVITKTTLSGLTPVVEDMDMSPGAYVYATRLQNQLNPGLLPTLDELDFALSDDAAHISCRYMDSMGRFPLSIHAEFLPGQSFTLFPSSLDHSQALVYRSANLLGLLDEYDDTQLRISASLDNQNWAFSPSQTYSYILGLPAPEALGISAGSNSVGLSWDPVQQTLLGTAVEPDYYLVEADQEPSFSAPRTLDPVYDTNITLPITNPREFYRVRAIKVLP